MKASVQPRKLTRQVIHSVFYSMTSIAVQVQKHPRKTPQQHTKKAHNNTLAVSTCKDFKELCPLYISGVNAISHTAIQQASHLQLMLQIFGQMCNKFFRFSLSVKSKPVHKTQIFSSRKSCIIGALLVQMQAGAIPAFKYHPCKKTMNLLSF